MKLFFIFALVSGSAIAEIFFEERFQDGGKVIDRFFLLYDVEFDAMFSDAWESRWVSSTHKGNDAGKFVLTAGKFYGDAEKNKGIQTSQVFPTSCDPVPITTIYIYFFIFRMPSFTLLLLLSSPFQTEINPLFSNLP